jgi:hypothetical protein
VNDIGMWDEWTRENNQEHWKADAAHWYWDLVGLKSAHAAGSRIKGIFWKAMLQLKKAMHCNEIFQAL